jgi:hypothetical protein
MAVLIAFDTGCKELRSLSKMRKMILGKQSKKT